MEVKELHKREADGVSVTLFAHFEGTECLEISCRVIDSRAGDDFVISDIPKNQALDVFYHPYASGHQLLTSGALAQVTENTILLDEA